MANTTITIRIDEDLKKQAEVLFDEMGLNMTTAYTIFTKAVVREKKIPFEVSAISYNTETIQALEDVKNNRNLSRSFDSIDELMEDLNA